MAAVHAGASGLEGVAAKLLETHLGASVLVDNFCCMHRRQFINPPVTPAVRPKLTRQQRERLEERRRAKAKLSILQWRNEQERFGERWYSDPNNFRGPARQSRGALHAPPVYRQPPLRPSTMLSRA